MEKDKRKWGENRMKILMTNILALCLMIAPCACSCNNNASDKANNSDIPAEEASVQATSAAEKTNRSTDEKTENTGMQLTIGDKKVTVEWEDNASANALMELCVEKPLTIQMSMYGGFEQVGSLGTSLPRDDVQTTTSAGDIVLYSGNQIVVFYGSNSWAYTRLGKITGLTAGELKELLGNGDVTITIGK